MSFSNSTSRGITSFAPGIFQYGAGVSARCSTSPRVRMAALTTGDSSLTEPNS